MALSVPRLMPFSQFEDDPLVAMSAATDFVTSGSLKVLINTPRIDRDGIDIILIPGIGTAQPEAWPFASSSWLSDLPCGDRHMRVFSYHYGSPLTNAKAPWEAVIMRGYDFLEQMARMRSEMDEDTAMNRPIMMVCHSLGGILFKQALCVATEQIHRYGTILNAIVGIVFLSTPHQYGDAMTTWTRFRDILEATTGKNLKVAPSIAEQEGAILLNLVERFNALSLRTPILSVYEMRESKSASVPLRKNQLLVNRDACITDAPMETVLGLNLNHYDTCLFTMSADGEGLVKFYKFLKDTLGTAHDLVASRLEEVEYQYATMSTYSPTMSELPYKAEKLQLTEWPSNNATEWPSNEATEGTSLSGFEMIHPAASKAEMSKSINLPCYLIDTRSENEDFCGREDVLDRLAAELLPSKKLVTASGSGLQQFAICGLGGIGKTEIAREFSRRHKAAFDAVFWVVADETAKLDDQYQRISLALGLEEESECKNQVVSRELVKGWLSNSRKQLYKSEGATSACQTGQEATWLLIFDNADDPMILADYWPQGSGSILITSRDPLAKSMFTRRTSGLDLEPLTLPESVSLFNHLTTFSGEPEDDAAKQISELLGGMPLAISQMAGIIRRQDLTLEEFLELYADLEEHSTLYETKFDSNLVPYRHSLSTVWAFEKLKPQARQLLELLSFLDPDAVEEGLLMEAAAEHFDGAPFKKSNYLEARADLLQSSLVQRNKKKQILSVHRIVQDAILATMDMEKKKSMFDKIVRLLWSEWPSALPKPSRKPELPQPKSSGGRLHVGRWPACSAIYPHVLRVHQLWRAITSPSSASAILFAQLLAEAAWYQKERGRWNDFDGFFETALGICETSTHPDRDSVLADIYFSLGAVAMDSNDFDSSRTYKEKSLDLVSKICNELGTVDERLYLAYAERGISRTQDKRYAEGEADLKYALEIRKSLGNYVPRSGEANLSWCLLAQGKLDECNTLLLESLAGRERALGVNDRESVRTGLILYVLGNLRAVEGKLDESYEYHQRAWKHMLETVGERDFYTANITHKIAEHLMRLGEHEKAINTINLALDIWAVDPKAHKNEIARSTFLKGKLFESMDKGQKASIALRVASRLRKEITKEDRDVKSLTTEDFDDIVAFWCR